MSGWARAQRVMMGQTMDPKQGSLTQICVSYLFLLGMRGLFEVANTSVSCMPSSASGALPEAAQQHLSPRAVMLSLVPPAYARHALPSGR